MNHQQPREILSIPKRRPAWVKVAHYLVGFLCGVAAVLFVLGAAAGVWLGLSAVVSISSFLLLLGGAYIVLAWGWFRHRAWVWWPFVAVSVSWLGQVVVSYLYGLQHIATFYFYSLSAAVGFLVFFTLALWFTREYLRGVVSKPVLQLPLMVVLLAPLFISSLPMMYLDGPPVEDAVLEIDPFVPVADEDNMLLAVLHPDQMTEEENRAIDWGYDAEMLTALQEGALTATSAEVVSYVEDTQRLADSFLAGTDRSQFESCRPVYLEGVPESVDRLFTHGYGSDCRSFSGMQQNGYVVAVHALYHAQLGNLDQALRYATAPLEYGNAMRRATSAGGGIINYLVATTVTERGLQAHEYLLESSGTLSAAQKKTMRDTLERTQVTDEQLHSVVKDEYNYRKPYVLAVSAIYALPRAERNQVKETFEQASSTETFFDVYPSDLIAMRYFYHPNDTLRLYHDYHDLYVAYPNLCDPQQQAARQTAQDQQQERSLNFLAMDELSYILRPNHFGKIMFWSSSAIGTYETLVTHSHCPLQKRFAELQRSVEEM